MIFDSIAGHDMLLFMDDFFGYNQILINPTDQYKITFITLWSKFCWKVISFGLKKVGATYKRAMVTMFHEYIHKMMEVYVDNILVKS